MIVAVCQHDNFKVHGKSKSGDTRYKCKDCGKTFTKSTQALDGMRVGMDRATRIIEMLLEGLSIATVSRLTDTDKHTIIDLMVMVGERCERYMADAFRGLKCGEIQADEIWGYVGMKQKTANRLGFDGRVGDTYCYTAIDRDSKLLVSWHLGDRDQVNTDIFCRKLNTAIGGRFHLSTDGYHTYQPGVSWFLFGKVDYGQVVKIFGEAPKDERRKYSPARIIDMRKQAIMGNPDMDKVCTSHCERMNGTIRNFTKRMARLTYAFSKKWSNHKAALGLFFCAYNFCKPHKTLKGNTPAMAHGIADHKWSVRELLETTA
jgi:transposase-like protein/IS1 family transposase